MNEEDAKKCLEALNDFIKYSSKYNGLNFCFIVFGKTGFDIASSVDLKFAKAAIIQVLNSEAKPKTIN